MGFYGGLSLPLWKWARGYTLADNFFIGAVGGAYLQPLWAICALSPPRHQAPARLGAQLLRERVRRFVPHPSVADRRLHAAERSRAAELARAGGRAGLVEIGAHFACVGRHRRGRVSRR